jgi:hypothetical protein
MYTLKTDGLKVAVQNANMHIYVYTYTRMIYTLVQILHMYVHCNVRKVLRYDSGRANYSTVDGSAIWTLGSCSVLMLCVEAR